VCWDATGKSAKGGRARERRRQGMCVGSRARDAQGSKALKGEVVQGMRVRTPREEEVK
jgi:hypothetical protein